MPPLNRLEGEKVKIIYIDFSLSINSPFMERCTYFLMNFASSDCMVDISRFNSELVTQYR